MGTETVACARCRSAALNPAAAAVDLLGMGSRSSARRDSAFAVIVRKSHVLLVRPRGRDRWKLPGGRLRRGEKHWDALRREVWEETGLRPRILGLTGVYARSDGTRAVIFVARVSGAADPVGPRHEIAEQRWVRVQQARARLGRKARRRLDDVLAADAVRGTRRASNSKLRTQLRRIG